MQVLHRPFALAIAAFVAASSAHAQVDPQKQKAIDRILAASALEAPVVARAQAPGAAALENSSSALAARQVAKPLADKTLKDIATDVQKYVDTVTPLVTTDAKKNESPTLSPILAQNFSADELNQLATMLESPAFVKLQKLQPELQKALNLKVQKDVEKDVNAAIATLQQAVGLKLRAAVTINQQQQ